MPTETPHIDTDARHRQAILMLVITALLWSLGGVLIKNIHWHPVAIAGTRSLIGAVMIWIFFYRQLRFTWSWIEISAAIAYAGTVVLFVIANKLTTAANAILLQYTAPFYVILFSPWFLGEPATRSDWMALCIIMIGMMLFFFDDLTMHGYLGNAIALLSGLCFAWLTLFLRRQKDGSALPSLLLGNLLAGMIGITFILQSPPESADWIYLLLLGVVQLGIPYILYAVALRYIRAIEGILIPMIEPVLNPVWVFLLLGEQPSIWAMFGGVMILGAVFFRASYNAE